MAQTMTTPRTKLAPPSGNGTRLVPPGRQRSIPLAVLGVLLCFLGALVFGALHLRLDHRATVLALGRPVAAGQVIHESDLREVRVSADGLDSIAAADRSTVVGHVAAVPLVTGSLLVRSELGSAASIQSGQAVVGLALKEGQLPAGLRPGDHVLVVDTGARTAPATGSAPARVLDGRVEATVVSIAASSNSPGVTVLSLNVDESDASGVAAAAAAGQVSVVLVAAGS
jgi:hypothetical protein